MSPQLIKTAGYLFVIATVIAVPIMMGTFGFGEQLFDTRPLSVLIADQFANEAGF